MKIQLDAVKSQEIVPGYQAKFVHSDSMTIAYWDIKAGNCLPSHSHMHEQIMTLLDGEFELTVAGEPHHMVAGDVVVIESNVEHSGRSITDCRAMDVFSPVREDYLFDS